MTREQVKAALPILQAFADLQTVQYQSPCGKWSDIDSMDPFLVVESPQRYRIKPEKRGWWIHPCSLGESIYTRRSDAPESMRHALVYVEEVLQ